MFQWQLELSDNDGLRAWFCTMPDGSELFVEQTYTTEASYPMWKSLVKLGLYGGYQNVRANNSAVFKSRIEAQETAELFYVTKKET